jgi:hypothetical protein
MSVEGVQPSKTPAVWVWFVVYCIVLCIGYLCCAGLGLFLLVAGPQLGGEADHLPMRLVGAAYMLLGFVFLIPTAFGPFLPAKPWAWVYGLVLICMGFTSCCCIPFSVPLLIYWIKPEGRAYFGRD